MKEGVASITLQPITCLSILLLFLLLVEMPFIAPIEKTLLTNIKQKVIQRTFFLPS